MKENNIKFYNTNELDLLSSGYFKEDKSNFYKHINDEDIDNIYIGGKALIVNTINDSNLIPLIFELGASFKGLPYNKYEVSKMLLKDLTRQTNKFLINGEVLSNPNYIYIDTTLPENKLTFSFPTKTYDESKYLSSMHSIVDPFTGMGFVFKHIEGFKYNYNHVSERNLGVVTYTFDTSWYLENKLIVETLDSSGPSYS